MALDTKEKAVSELLGTIQTKICDISDIIGMAQGNGDFKRTELNVIGKRLLSITLAFQVLDSLLTLK